VETVRAQARGLGIGHRVHLAGRLADPGSAFHAADVLVFPSAYEAYPLVVLEALAHGVPVVATAVGSVPDLVRDGVNGFVVPPESAAVRERLLELYSLPRACFSGAARATAEDHDWSKVALQYGELVEQLPRVEPTASKSRFRRG
jgi:glycosyltransferase involved in cell wall biosynthesis